MYRIAVQQANAQTEQPRAEQIDAKLTVTVLYNDDLQSWDVIRQGNIRLLRALYTLI